MDAEDIQDLVEPEIFQRVEVVIDSTCKELLGDKCDTYLKEVAHSTDMKLIKTNGKQMFQGDWKNAEKAYKLLQNRVYSAIGLTEMKCEFTNDNSEISSDVAGIISSDDVAKRSSDDSTVIETRVFRNKKPFLDPANSYYSPINIVNLFQSDSSKEMNSNVTLLNKHGVVFSAEHRGTSVSIVYGNLLAENVEAVVCPVSPEFSESYLVSALCKASGCSEKILVQKLKGPNDIFYFKSKNSSHSVIFISLPEVTIHYIKNLELLMGIYTNIFNFSEKMNFRSLAMPSVGSGQSEFPVDVSANAAWKALENQAEKLKKRCLRMVRFVHIESEVAFYFKTIFESLISVNQKSSRSHSSSPPVLDESTGAISKLSSANISSDSSLKISTIEKENEKLDNLCPICLSDIKNREILECGHKFCKPCLTLSFEQRKECPVCRKQYGIIVGNQPPGVMNFYIEDSALPGFLKTKTIIIEYRFNDGIQRPGDPNPGHNYFGTYRVAYLPDCHEGRKVYKFLKTAFDRKLTFTIGTSASTGRNNMVIWNGIHHKTSKSGGPTQYGYPDPDYLPRVLEELAARGIK